MSLLETSSLVVLSVLLEFSVHYMYMYKQGFVILTSGVLSELQREFKKGNTLMMGL